MVIDQIPDIIHVHVFDVVNLLLPDPVVHNFQKILFRHGESVDIFMRLVHKFRHFVVKTREVTNHILVRFYTDSLVDLVE